MNFIKESKKYKPKDIYFKLFINKFWFIPSDVLQRSIEASIWDLCKFKHPILDIGIGNGAITPIIFKNIKKIDVGIDIEPSGLDNAIKTGKYKKVLCEDAAKMGLKSSLFNTVISNSTFEHIEKDLVAVSEVSRVLKKNGLFFFTVPSNFLPKWVLELEENNPIQKLNKFNKRANHLHYRSISEWNKVFNDDGMKIEFYKFYYPKNVAMFWYKMFKFFTYKLNNKEIWSYIGYSKVSKLIPKNIFKYFEEKILWKSFRKGFLSDSNEGAMLFMVVKKL
nr:class I SAM-dependent methyltransferase [Candidatus Levybacteria bacterium]